ncbi:response regulator [Povalibacter sp.]|uniref:response regulator transcription factor n=1 Tax=Povalibacter sp. TaxID=1962978 RepID=UPI002F3FF88B
MIQKVLIVDDSKLARMAAAKALKALHPDWVLLEAANAEEGLARVRDSSPEFALLDFNMPGKDGIVLAAELRDLNPRMSIAVISANHQVEVIGRARAAGAVFLAKPLTERALGDYLNVAVEQRSAATE